MHQTGGTGACQELRRRRPIHGHHRMTIGPKLYGVWLVASQELEVGEVNLARHRQGMTIIDSVRGRWKGGGATNFCGQMSLIPM